MEYVPSIRQTLEYIERYRWAIRTFLEGEDPVFADVQVHVVYSDPCNPESGYSPETTALFEAVKWLLGQHGMEYHETRVLGMRQEMWGFRVAPSGT